MTAIRLRGRFPLDARTATIPAHGQLATRVPTGLTVAATKVIREGYRARVLLIPGLLRVELEVEEDTVHSRVRGLNGTQLDWASTAQTETLAGHGIAPCIMRSSLTLHRGLATATADLTLVATPLESASRITARADITPTAAVPTAALTAFA